VSQEVPTARSALHRAGVLASAALLATAPVSAQAPPTVPVRIIAINDFHGHLEPGENTVLLPDPEQPAKIVSLRSGGAAYLATRIGQLRAAQPHSVVVSAGDLIGASPLVRRCSATSRPIEAMNASAST
jgi:5'-nucleotidase